MLSVMARFTVLEEQKIIDALKELPEWEVKDNKLYAKYTFDTFRTAFAFITLVAIEAEKMDHHPEWSNVYNTVEFEFSTHDAGDKITDLDVAMAHYIHTAANTVA